MSSAVLQYSSLYCWWRRLLSDTVIIVVVVVIIIIIIIIIIEWYIPGGTQPSSQVGATLRQTPAFHSS